MDAKLESEFFMAFGKYSYWFSVMEEEVKVFINRLLNSKDTSVGRHVTAGMPFKQLRISLMSLYRYHQKEPDQIIGLENVLKELKKINDERNDFIHSVWGTDALPDSAIRKKFTSNFGKGLIADITEYTPAAIDNATERLIETTKALMRYSDSWVLTAFLNSKD
jgi:hypothetical protein